MANTYTQIYLHVVYQIRLSKGEQIGLSKAKSEVVIALSSDKIPVG
jgi:hypothetical protein